MGQKNWKFKLRFYEYFLLFNVQSVPSVLSLGNWYRVTPIAFYRVAKTNANRIGLFLFSCSGCPAGQPDYDRGKA